MQRGWNVSSAPFPEMFHWFNVVCVLYLEESWLSYLSICINWIRSAISCTFRRYIHYRNVVSTSSVLVRSELLWFIWFIDLLSVTLKITVKHWHCNGHTQRSTGNSCTLSAHIFTHLYQPLFSPPPWMYIVNRKLFIPKLNDNNVINTIQDVLKHLFTNSVQGKTYLYVCA